MMIDGYIKLFVVFIAATALLSLLIFFIQKKKDKEFLRRLSYLLCFWSFFIVVFATVILFNLPLRFNPEQSVLNLYPLQWLREDNITQRIVTEIRPNIMLFIPLGIFTPIAFKRMRKFYMTAMVTLAVTFSIEFFQYFIGRSCDVDDIIANLLGGMIGYGVFKVFSFLFKSKMWWNKLTATEA